MSSSRDEQGRQNALGKGKIPGVQFLQAQREVLIRVATRSLERFREKLRRLTKRTRSGKLEELVEQINRYTMGWIGYFWQANTPSVYERLDQWIRGRLRQMIWKRWKRVHIPVMSHSDSGVCRTVWEEKTLVKNSIH